MDYLGLPKVKSYLTPMVIVLDIQHRVAGIPGSGNTPVVLTTTKDVGKFVVASLGLEKWSERSIMVGDRKTWNEILAIAEKATGMMISIHHYLLECWLILSSSRNKIPDFLRLRREAAKGPHHRTA